MRHPRAVEAVGCLAALVGGDRGERALGDLGVAAVRDERAHAADRVRAALVARRDEELGVRPHERHGHGDRLAVGHHPAAATRAERLHDREDVVPAAGVEAGAVVAQLVEDLVHLERGLDRLDEHGRAHGALRDAERAPARRRRCRSTASPRGATRASAGRSTGRGPPRSAPARCGRSRARSRRASPRRASPGRRGRGTSGASPPGASRADASRWSASRAAVTRYSLPSGLVYSSVPRRKSRRVSCPSITFAQVGLVASSWSASQTFAPEFSALIAILRSVGPVISTRRSSRPGAVPATRHDGSLRIHSVSGRNLGSRPFAASTAGLQAHREQLVPGVREAVVQLGEERERLGREDLVVARSERGGHLDPGLEGLEAAGGGRGLDATGGCRGIRSLERHGGRGVHGRVSFGTSVEERGARIETEWRGLDTALARLLDRRDQNCSSSVDPTRARVALLGFSAVAIWSK